MVCLTESTMLQTTHPSGRLQEALALRSTDPKDAVYQAYKLLHVGFTIPTIVAGLDKFFDVLVNWDAYLAPIVNRVLAGHGHVFIHAFSPTSWRHGCSESS